MSRIRSRSQRLNQSFDTPRHKHTLTVSTQGLTDMLKPEPPATCRANPSPKQKLFHQRFPQRNVTVRSRIQSRKKVAEELQITPELAAKVVRDYLLPMFEGAKRYETERARASAFGIEVVWQEETADTILRISHTGTNPQGGSIYTELKLSEQMYEELSRTRIELEALRRRLKEAEQRKESSEYELNRALHTIAAQQTDIKMMRFQCAEYEKTVQSVGFRYTETAALLGQTMANCQQLEMKCKVYASTLHEERANFDIRFD